MDDKLDMLISKVDNMESKTNKLDTLIKKVDNMESKTDKLDMLISKVDSIESDVNSIKVNVRTIKTDIKELKKDVKQLQKNDDYMFDSIKDLRERTEGKIDNLTKITEIYSTRLTNQGEKIDISIRDRINKTNDTMQDLYQESKQDREELHKQLNKLSKIIMS